MKKIKVSILSIILLISAYSIWVEPLLLEETFHQVSIGAQNNSLLVAHITDLHTHGLNSVEQKLLTAIQNHKPDIILITGDIATPGGTEVGYEEVLSKLKAPLGVYFVQGNWEYWEPIKELKKIFKKAGIVDLTNKSIQIKNDLWLVGLDDEFVGFPELKVYEEIPKTSKIISIYHSPITFESTKNKTDLSFAGHSHGGQIRLPFIGSFWTPEGTGNYDAGWFKKGRSKMFVSRGIGNSILPIRFNCRPEIAFIRVNY